MSRILHFRRKKFLYISGSVHNISLEIIFFPSVKGSRLKIEINKHQRNLRDHFIQVSIICSIRPHDLTTLNCTCTSCRTLFGFFPTGLCTIYTGILYQEATHWAHQITMVLECGFNSLVTHWVISSSVTTMFVDMVNFLSITLVIASKHKQT